MRGKNILRTDAETDVLNERLTWMFFYCISNTEAEDQHTNKHFCEHVV